MSPQITVFQFFIQALRPRKYWYLVRQWFCFGWSIDHTLFPLIYGSFIDTVVRYQGDPGDAWPAIKEIVFIGLGLWFYCEASYRGSGCINAKIAPETEAEVRVQLFDAVKVHSHRYFIDHFAGDIANRISEMPKAMTEVMDLFMELLLPVLLAATIAISVTWFWVNPKIAGILTGYLILHLGLCLLTAKRMSYYASIHSEKRNILNGKIIDSLSNHVVWRLFSRRKFEQKNVESSQTEELLAQKKLLFCAEKIKFGLSLFGILGPGVMIHGCLIVFWMHGDISIGDLVLVFNLTWSMQLLAWFAGMELPNFFKQLGICHQALSLIHEGPEIVDAKDAKSLVVHAGSIKFDRIGFTYKQATPLFQNLSVEIKAGEKIGLVGYSGSGKTSFVSLLLRLFDIDEGRITIDGQDINRVTQDSLRENIGMIAQEPFLFHRTLKENITYGRLDASMDEVIRATQLAGAHGFIQTLPQAYQTMVGERGIKLSGGQRQRIAIARVILKNAPILIMDEATSALDSVTEQEIQNSLELLMQHKTTIVIAHRLSTLLKMDRILVFDKGHIVEDGSHEILLAKNGLYTKLWTAQVGGFLPDA